MALLRECRQDGEGKSHHSALASRSLVLSNGQMNSISTLSDDDDDEKADQDDVQK